MTGRNDRSSARIVSRIQAALIIGLAIWGLLALRLVLIQVVHGPRLAGLAERQHVASVLLTPDRGIIYDRNMTPLTDNLSVRSACAYPSEIESPRATARALARILGGSYDHYLSLLTEERNFVWIERQLPPEKSEALVDADLQGIGFHKENKRVYPHGRRAGQLLGFTDVDGRGIAGVEAQTEELLKGSEARVYHCLDSAGRRTPTPACTKIVPRDGADVVLTIDLNLQSIAEVELERAVRENGATKGMVLMQDPWTGEILAMASWPPFDPNSPQRYSVESQKNRPVTDQYEPGSTFKTITACAALPTGAADLSSVYYAGRGSMLFGGSRRFRIRDVHPYGWLDLRGATKHSSNVAFAQIGAATGDVALYSFARAFGFGCPTGIELPGEVRGVLHDPGEWSARSAHTVAIGQEVAVTGLQLIGAYSAVANGGYLMEPRIIKSVISEDGEVIRDSRPAVVRKAVDTEVAALVRGLLTAVTEEGSGRNARLAEILVAGKTGTAQKAIPGAGGFSSDKFVSSFAGMAPAHDPQIVCLIVIDEPEGRGLGGRVAAPAFARIMERVTRGAGRRYVIRDGAACPDFAEVPDRTVPRPGMAAASWNRPAVSDDAIERAFYCGSDLRARETEGAGAGACSPASAASSGPHDAVYAAATLCPTELPDVARVPDLRGMSIRLARQQATRVGLELVFDGSGSVRSQSPRPGASVATGSKVMVSCRP